MKKLFALLLIFMMSTGSLFAYDLTDRDNEILDKVEAKLINKIDDHNKLTPEIVIAYIERILEKKKLSDRTQTLLEVIQEDIAYIYYVGEYSSEGDENYAMTIDDCYEDEYFDQDTQLCYFDDSQYSEGDDEQNYETGESNSHEDFNEEEQVLAEYAVSGDTITFVKGSDTEKAKAVWKAFSTLIPLSVRGDFHKYLVVDDENSDTAAHVVQDDTENEKWNISVNLAVVYVDGKIDSEGYATLIHEFAHVLTLNKTQMRYVPVTQNEDVLQRFEENCQGNFLQEGCLNEDAYLDDFIDLYWADKNMLDKVRNEEIHAYDGNESSFITEYAATNPGEDIAESFTYFVLKSKTDGSTIADKKLTFFYNYKPLETLRKQIRSRLETLK